MAISIVQSTHGNSGSGSTFTSISATWGGATTTGNTLIAIFGFEGTVTGTITYPASWTGAQEETGSPFTATNVTLRVVHLANAASQSGTITFTISGTTAGLVLMEISGLGASPTLDTVSAGANPTTPNSGNSTTLTTNALTATNGATDLYIGAAVAGGTAGVTLSFSSPTGGFGSLIQDGNFHSSAPKSDGFVGVTSLIGNAGSTSTGLTLSTSANWLQVILAYTAASTFDPSNVPWGDMRYTLPPPRPNPDVRPTFMEPAAGWWINQPNLPIDPSKDPVWIPEEEPSPIPRQKPQTAPYEFTPGPYNILPPGIHYGAIQGASDLGLPFRRPQPVIAPAHFEPGSQTTQPATIETAAIQTLADRPLPRPELLKTPFHMEATAAWMYPAIVPPGFPATAFLPDRPLPRPQLAVSAMPVEMEPGAPKAPFIDLLGMSWNLPLDQPQLVRPRVAYAALPAESPTFTVTGISIGWDSPQVNLPRTPARVPPSPPMEARPDVFPKDDLGALSGWRQETVGLPVTRPRTLAYAPFETRTDLPAIYDPESVRAALDTVLDRPIARPSPLRELPNDPTIAWSVAASAVAQDSTFFSPLPDRPMARPALASEGWSNLTLTVAEAAMSPLPFADLWNLPQARPRPIFTEFSFEPSWYAVLAPTVIIVGPPYYAVARQMTVVCFAVAGQILTE